MTVTQNEMLIMAMQELGGRRTLSELSAWCAVRGVNMGDPHAVASANTVNDRNRYMGNRCGIRQDYRTDQGHPKDKLYRRGTPRDKTYELYDNFLHGVWDRREVSPGKYVPFCLVEPEMVQAHTEGEEHAPQVADGDNRKKIRRMIAEREGRPAFRSALIRAYRSRCAVTGCAVVDILEAAHIKPYRGPGSNHVRNGLLLRADVHTLFDKGLLWFTESWRIVTAQRLDGSEYESLKGQSIFLPENISEQPLPENLSDHRAFSLDLENRRRWEDSTEELV